ncbi:phage regulatory CII family protein [Ralstonia pseudosolanacearum]|uniref:phage regulatory CII family protein n=1 Tax=Ralstonia pseudosolanacearum TaxID=1310165 RepID=UPI003CF7E01F
MRHQYSDIDQHDVLYSVARAYPGGIAALAPRMGMTAPVLRNKLRPGVDTHYMSFEQVSLLLELVDEAKVANAKLPIRAFCWRHGMVALDIDRVRADALTDTDLNRAYGNVLSELEFEQLVGAAMRFREMLHERAAKDSGVRRG